MKRLLLLIPLAFFYSGGYVGHRSENLAIYIKSCDWGEAFSYVSRNRDVPDSLINYVKMRYFEEINNLDSAFFYALLSESMGNVSYSAIRIYKKTGNDSLILKYAEMENDSLIKLFYFLDKNEVDSAFAYRHVLIDTLFYTTYKLLLFGRKYTKYKNAIRRTNYDTRAYVYERLSMYRKAAGIRKKLLRFRGTRNIYRLGRDYYLMGDRERAYYYFRMLINNFPYSEYALKALNLLRSGRKIHGKTRYISARIYMHFGLYRNALSIIAPLSRYSKGNRNIRAVCYYHIRRYRKAISLLWRKRRNKNSDASFYIGVSYYKIGKKKKAVKYLKYYIKHCRNIGNHTGEAYYRLAQTDKVNRVDYYKLSLGYNAPYYFKERAIFSVFESGDTASYQDIINQFVTKTGSLSPKTVYVLTKMSIALHNSGLAEYYENYLKDRYPLSYYRVEAVADSLNNFSSIGDDSLLFPLKVGIMCGYQRIVKKIIRESMDSKYYLNLAKYACESGNYPLSINFATKYLNYCVSDGKRINDSLYYFLFPRGYAAIVRKASAKYDVDKSLIYAIMREESWFQKRAVSRMGAIGVMQILPSTFRYLNGSKRRDYYNLFYNIDTGTKYLSELEKRYKGNLLQVIAHYNGGGVTADNGGDPNFIEHIPYVETEKYVKNVVRSYEIYKILYGIN